MGKLEWNSTGEVVTTGTLGTITTVIYYVVPSKPSLWRRILRRFSR